MATQDAARNHGGDPGDAAATRHAAIALIIAAVVFLGGLAVFGSWTGPNGASNATGVFVVLVDSVPWAGLWLGAAWGFGWYVRRFLFRHVRHGCALQGGVGVAALLWIDATLGTIGLLQFTSAILVLAAGLSGVVLQFRHASQHSGDGLKTGAFLPAWPWWLTVPALVALIGAATVAPGWIWGSEFGGYDAMSYHLQLPREWLAAGSIQTLEHNVYSGLPGFMESVYLHLMVLHPGSASLSSCQLIHSACAVFAACAVGSAAGRLRSGADLGDSADRVWRSVVAGGLLIGTPWVVVTGSLAYNECAVILMLATAVLCVVDDDGWSPTRCGVVLALLCGAAIGAKLTSAFFVLAPVTVMALLLRPRFFLRPTAVLMALVVGVVVLSSWLFRNWDATSNPVFPFATGLFGSGHWTEAQVAAWSAGHGFDGTLGDRLAEGWRQFFQFGIGSNPYAGTQEPWSPQWLVLPWLAFAGCIAGMMRERTRRISMVLLVMALIQVLAWLSFTHIKSRFMLPFVVPGVLGATLLLPTGRLSHGMRGVLAPCVLLWCIVPLWMLKSEQDGRPAVMVGGATLRSGDGLSDAERASLARTTFPECLVNHVLPDDASVLLIGEAAPLYYALDRVTYCTVWDRGPFTSIIAASPDDATAWIDPLIAAGFTHVLVDPTMLTIWHESGWGDPLLDAGVVMNGFGSTCPVEAQYPNGTTVFRLVSPDN